MNHVCSDCGCKFNINESEECPVCELYVDTFEPQRLANLNTYDAYISLDDEELCI